MPTQTATTRGESAILNPVFTGLVQEIKASDFDLSANAMFATKTFKSNGDGRGYYRRRLYADSLRQLDDLDLVRRAGVPAKKMDRDMTLSQFGVVRRHLDAVVSLDDARLLSGMEGGVQDPNESEVKWVRELMFLHKERRAAAFALDNTNVGGTLTPATLWSVATADIVSDIVAARLAVRQQCGRKANVIALAWELALQMTKNDSVIKLRSSLKDRDMTEDGVAALIKNAFGFEKVILHTSVYNGNAADVAGTWSMNPVWGNSVYVYYEPKGGADFDKISWAVEATDSFYYGGLEAGVYSFEDRDAETMVHRIKEDSEFILLSPETAFAIRGTI